MVSSQFQADRWRASSLVFSNYSFRKIDELQYCQYKTGLKRYRDISKYFEYICRLS